jgi:hypothetical protein
MMVGSQVAKDLGAVFNAHVKAEFVDMDVAATMATMTPPSYLPCSDPDGRHRAGAGRKFLSRPICRPLAG